MGLKLNYCGRKEQVDKSRSLLNHLHLLSYSNCLFLSSPLELTRTRTRTRTEPYLSRILTHTFPFFTLLPNKT
ncbi:hypothetical protein L6452_10799 [Arctium lappa]|uniref:Uncharacterized protein n=1 Tax=Arctium lappa TaxID=4217 RepID=A0ACB9DMS5_ARCLA|nr:hypothetical protein L6452_10799 [Arctium lappa]